MMLYDEIFNLNAQELKLLDIEIKTLLERHFSQINDDLTNFLLKNSKRLRSNLIFLFAKALNLNINSQVIKLASAIELLHSATLIHDDIIDEAKIRRGFETLNIKYNPKVAVISGDFVLTLMIDELLALNSPQILSIFSSSISKLCLGELKQNFDINKLSSLEEYIKKSSDKTASLFEAGLHSLAQLFNLKEFEQNMISFSNNFGIAFQIKDDLKNISKKDNLKLSLSDFNNGIYTAPVIFYHQKYSDIDNFQEIYGNNKTIRHEINSMTIDLIKKYSDKALDSVSFIEDNQFKNIIIKLCKQLWELD